MVFHIPALFDIRLSNPLQLSSPAGANQYLFSVLTMCSGIFVPLSEPDHLWKSQHGQKISLIQSLFPADRQLVCNSSMLSPWAMDFCGLSTCWVCGCFSICTVWVGTHTQNEGCGWQGSPTVFFLEQGRKSWGVPRKNLAVRLSSFGIYPSFLPKLFISLWQTAWSASSDFKIQPPWCFFKDS